MSTRAVVLSGAVLAASAFAMVPTASAAGGLFPCGTGGATPSGVDAIKARKISCADTRTVIRRIEVSNKPACRPQRDQQVAPYRICDVTVTISSGTRAFHCVGTIEGDSFRERCSSSGRVRVQYRRKFSASDR